MAADESLWWPVWGPWLLVEAIAVLSLVALVRAAVKYRSAKRAATRRPGEAAPGIIVYLDRQALQGIVVPENPRDQTLNRSVYFEFPLIGGGAGAAAERALPPPESPQAVLARLIRFLDSHDFLVHVDLGKLSVLGNRAARILVDEPAPAEVQLSAYSHKYVLVTGDFSVVDRGSTRLAFEAPCGTAADALKVQLHCNDTTRSEALPDRAMSCLGRIQWSSGTDGPFHIRAIAVFQ